MADNKTTALPDGTDTVIEGAAATMTAERSRRHVAGHRTRNPRAERRRRTPVSGSGSPESGLAERFRSGREKIAGQAGEKARGLVTPGPGANRRSPCQRLEDGRRHRPGIEERLGPEYGDYARRAAGAIENAANRIAEKDPDELIEDTRKFVRNSPGVALAGAAVVGFVVARLLKSGLASDEDEDEDDGD